jgi:trigger factor
MPAPAGQTSETTPEGEVGSPFDMKAEVAPMEGNRVKLSIDVDEGEVDEAIDATFERLTKELVVPGFRRGKVPRKVLEARLGRARARQEALDHYVPHWYERAVNDKAVDVIADPEINVTAGEDAGAVAFDAVVEVRPRLHLEGYDALKVTIPSPEVSEEDIQAQVDRLRGNFAELAIVEREARLGDSVVIDMSATRDGKPVAALSYADYSVELGSGNDLPELDEHLPGAKAGDRVSFDADLGEPVHVEVLVKQVQEKALPEETDEWAEEASEFSTVAELREDIKKRLSVMKRRQARAALRTATMDALIALVKEDPPAALVDAETRRMAEDLGRRLDSQGIALQRYLDAVGRSVEQVVGEMRLQAVPAVKADLALRAVADDLSIEPSEAEMDDFMERLARAAGVSPQVFRDQVERTGRRLAVRSDLKKSKAFDWLLEHAEVTDEEGKPVDRASLSADGEAAEDAADEEAAEYATDGVQKTTPSAAGQGTVQTALGSSDVQVTSASQLTATSLVGSGLAAQGGRELGDVAGAAEGAR